MTFTSKRRRGTESSEHKARQSCGKWVSFPRICGDILPGFCAIYASFSMVRGKEEMPEELAQRTVSRLFRRAEKPQASEEPGTSCQDVNVDSPCRLRRSKRVAARQEREANAPVQEEPSHSQKRICRRNARTSTTSSRLGYFQYLPEEVRVRRPAIKFQWVPL